MNSQRSHTEKINLIEEDKKIGINEVIKHNEVINNSLKPKYKMKSYCLKCKKDTENINLRVSNTSNGKECYYQNMQNVEVKNQDLLKIRKQKDY